MKLTEIAPRENWVVFERAFNERSGLNCCSIDKEGMRVTAYKAWANRLCPLIRGSAKSARIICEDQVAAVLERAKKGEGPEVIPCKAGLVRVFVPVCVGKKLIGVFGGCGQLPKNGKVDAIVVSSATGFGKKKIAALRQGIGHISPGEIAALVHHLEGEVQEFIFQMNKNLKNGGK